MKSKKTKEELIQQAIDNINQDREAAQELLQDVAEYIGQQKDRYSSTGMVAAKYLETLQRSNEQLVKLISLMKKVDEDKYGDLNKEDKEELYNEIEETE
jgi:parvulin-like peptidyl-prolyl isomerase